MSRGILLALLLVACNEAPEAMRKLEVPNGFQDLGGLRTKDGRTLRAGQIYQTTTLANVSEDDLFRLEQLGVRAVVSFRPMIDIEMNGKESLPDGAKLVWAPIKPESNDHVTSFLRAVANSENRPLVVQCAGGFAERTLLAALDRTPADEQSAQLRDQLLD
ncbi:MAG: tyrosine-protein phosphatase [Planctomycetota bacterium]|jgi:hypothetical protein